MWQYGPFRGVDGNHAKQSILDLVNGDPEVFYKIRLIDKAVGTVETVIDGASIVTQDGRFVPSPKGQVRDCYGIVKTLSPIGSGAGTASTLDDDRYTCYLVGKLPSEPENHEAALLLVYAGSFTPFEADCSAVKAELVAAKAERDALAAQQAVDGPEARESRIFKASHNAYFSE
jgi:hypothetical protein